MTLAGRTRSATHNLTPALAAGVIVAAMGVIVSNITGLNHHLFPLGLAAAPPIAMRFARDEPQPLGEAALVVAFGLVLIPGGWLILIATGERPEATFVDGQPGGAIGEAVMLAAAGIVIGFWRALSGQAKGGDRPERSEP